MTKTKKVVAAMLAFLMIFSSASVLASAWDAAVDDGKTLDISTKFFKEVSGEWVETQKVRPGDVVKARVYVGTDYYSNDSTLLFFYDKDFFTHSYAAGKNTLEVNTQSGSFATANGVAGTFTANPNLNSQVANGYVDSAFLDSYAAFAVNVEVKSANEKNVMYDNSDWLFEFTLTVADNARGEGDLFVKDTTVQNTTTQTNAAVNVPKGPADGTDADLWAMWLWDATPVLSSQPVSTISSVTFKANTGAFAAADTETYIVEDMIDTAIDASAIPAVSKEGYTFMGWIDASDETPTLEECIEAPAAIPENDLVLNAYWLKNVDITFDTDGGSEIPPLTNVTPYEPFASIENPTKAGYTFVGWDVRGGALPATYPDVDTTYTAIWALNVTVSFDTDGADPIAPIDGYAGQTFDKDAIANPAKEGHRFVKWEPSLPDVFPEASTTYKAIFETITYNVIYVVDGKFASTAQVEYGQVIPTSVTTIKLGEGKAISGWYTDSGYQTPLAGGAVMGTQSITLYAYTYNDTFDAVFMVDGDVYATVPTVYEDYIIAPENPTKPGYVFEGWEPEVGLMDSEGKTFYATWVEAESTVKYMVDGAIYEAYNIAFGDSLDVPADPSKTGYTFLGWTDVDGSTEVITLPDIMPDNEVVYYAVWEVNQYTITFNTDGGSTVNSITQDYNTTVTAPAEPTKTGYTFAGWYNGDVEVTFPVTMPVGGMNLTAHWTNNTDTAFSVVVNYTDVTTGEAATEVFPFTGTTGNTIAIVDAIPETPADNTTYVLISDLTVSHYELDTTAANELTGTIAADGSTVLNVYYVPVKVTATFTVDGVKYDEKVLDYYSYLVLPETDPTKEGYTFAGWGATEQTRIYSDRTFEAKFTINQYTITFDTDGGSTVAPITQDYNTAVTAPADPTKTGYTFNGWSPAVPAKMPAGDMTVTAQWTINDYTITFDTDGGSAVAPITQAYNTAVTAPANPTKTGYTFAGWTPAVPATMPAENVTITAQWTINQYTITFNTDGGSAVSPITQDYASVITAPENPTKTGYTFAGWSPAVPATMPAGDMTVTAQWTINEYTITFDTDGGSTVNPIAQDYGTAITAPEDPTKTGYTFAGWDKEIPATMPAENVTITAKWTINQYTITFNTDGGSEIAPITQNYATDVTAPANPTKTGYTFAGWTPEVPATMPAENVTVKAQWTINEYTITFDTDGGSEVAPITQNYATDVTAPANPTKTGYTFAGWTPEVPATMPAENVTVKAQWTINQYTITFNTDGGSDVAPITQNYATEVTAPENPTKTGYTFAGWYNGDVEVTFPVAMPVDGMNLTAHWTVNNYKVTWDVDGVKSEETYAYGATIVAPEAPTKTGYTFAGWTPEVAATMPAADVTYTATWTANTYNAVFDANGGYFDGDTTVTTKTVPTDYDATIAVPAAPEKPGYTFNGWDPTPATMNDVNGLTFTAKWIADTDTTYTVETYTMGTDGQYVMTSENKTGVTDTVVNVKPATVAEGFALNDEKSVYEGTVAADNSLVLKVYIDRISYNFKTVVDGVETSTAYLYGATVAAPEEPTKTGYTFAGWTPEVPATMPAADVTVTAQWTANDYTITFDTDGGSAVAPITQAYNTAVTAPADPTKTGYTFAGWTPAVPDTMPAENVTVKAQWNINSYKLSFEVDGAVVRGPEDVEFDSAITAPSVDEKEGYTFVGWFAKETGEAMPAKMPAKDVVYEAVWTNGTNTRYTIEVYMMDTNGNYSLSAATVAYGTTGSVQTIVPGTIVGCTVDTALSELSKAISADGSMVLKVYYARNIYTVTYDSEAPVNVYYGAAIPAYEPAAQTGKTFTGWSPEVPATMPAENLVFTSTWEDTLYTITYVVNGTKSVAQYAYGAAVVAPEDPTVDGMTFTGWEPAVPDTMPAEDLIIVAKFENAVYKVTYLTDVGGEVFEEMLVRAGETVPVPTETPEKEYYVFLNWDNVPAVMPANNITIVPVFERVPVKLIPMAGSTTVIDRDNMVIYGLRERLTEELLLGTYLDVEGDGYITITPVADRCYGTGTIVDLYDNVTGEKLETYVIVVFGDLNGDSRVNSTDASMADDEAFRLTSWSSQTKYVDGALVENPDYNPYRTMAADLNKDGKVNATDASDISNTSIGISLIDQTTGTVHR
ncbi:MAG: InlB B-repeat-containing protein [Oscillospiraceae bacterium]|nr:InlB B-repeat-containing protein [Oscillospiraceae bacterium]